MWLATRCKREYCQRLPGHQPSADQRCRARVTGCHRGRDEANSGGRTSIEANAFTASRTLREDAFGQALSAVAAVRALPDFEKQLVPSLLIGRITSTAPADASCELACAKFRECDFATVESL